ncbi:penicillin-binding protein 1C [Siphonobacter sp. SORGH_AS_1065]|uniref:penicillin-binding protein 1C n=1 Tax=Siphonobacter sp. SORGH_AS_1065 TaxID=3041795 RepID=UPI0027857F65|nr:penicillin-binding protein 1C [Siphonobacter sp. SORGH_AS_1065]MDQ1086729.1 penicillin-binding protein 1C [Siphonobacter sp. SORGH_AS_1065]
MRFTKAVWIFLLTAALLLLLDFLLPFRVNPRYSTLVEAADGSVLHAFLNEEDKWRLYTELEEISPTLRTTLIHKEDRWFYFHPGVNPLALVRALSTNLSRNKRSSGASTITMQVVRLLEPRPRTYLSKGIEILRAFQLEAHYSKDEILQLYINLVPYGSNIEGIKAASLLYFQKPPEVLSLAEVMALTIIPNRPSSLRPGKSNTYLLSERNRWLQRFKEEKLFDSQTITDAIAEPLLAKRVAAPQSAPHLALRLKSEFPDTPILKTTLQRARQSTLEKLTYNYVSRLKAMNIRNAAVLVINNRTMAVEAYVGSADFNDHTDGGQVDGIRAIRSPGSTLKPLLYATAFDAGLLTPKSILYDVPTNFQGFEPENFDQQFHGKVSVEFALANSLNVPAVQVLSQLGTTAFLEKLKKAEFKTIQKQSSKLGLSMILGGCGVTLEELTTLFASFANQGQFSKAYYLQKPEFHNPTSLISEEANFLINQILTQPTRPDLPNNYAYTYRLPRISWKTGTSFGKKDAWSIGYNAHYTVGVWVGNFSGEGVPELNGANIATPLLFEIFNSIDYNSTAQWFAQPEGLSHRMVCQETGQIPSSFCIHQIEDYYLPGVSSTQACEHKKSVWLDVRRRMSYCPYCMPETGVEQVFLPNDPPQLTQYYEARHISYEKIPPHNPSCTRVFGNASPLKITYPVEGSTYRLNRKDQTRLALTAQTASDTKTLYWYVNDVLVGSAAPQQSVFCQPSAGKVKISCVDDQGRVKTLWIQVNYD